MKLDVASKKYASKILLFTNHFYRYSIAMIIVAGLLLGVLSACNLDEPTDTLLEEYSIDDSIDDNHVKSINNILQERLTAIESEDYELYMASITKGNLFFYNEQERWFMEMIHDRVHDLTLEVISMDMIDEESIRVKIRQTHRTEEAFDFTYPLLFVNEEGQWMDHGYDFEVTSTDRFHVKYMEGEKRVDDFIFMLDDAFDHLDELYDLKPLSDYEMKLFNDQEMLRQRCIPSSPWLFTGWSEPDESLKIFTGHKESYEGYPGVVQHELVHHITIRMCNNNLPVWMLEGIAMFDGSAYYDHTSSTLLSSMTKEGVSLSIQDLELMDLSSVTITRQEITNFYNSGFLYMKYIHDTYGRHKMIELFTEAGKKPFHDSTLNETFYMENQKTATEVIQTVLGLSKQELSRAYLTWIDENYDTLWD